MPEPAIMNEQPIAPKLQLKKYQLERSSYGQQPAYLKLETPSEWFSYKFQEQAKIYGCPFLESVTPIDDCINRINPIAPNIDFLAAVLGGDSRLGHKVVYIEHEMAFYYYEPKEHVYKPTSEDKLGNLMRAYLIRCAEEMPGNVDKFNLAHTFRSDKIIRSIVHRAKSILSADASFFSVESKNQRQQGPELYERVARCFVEQVLERQAGEVLTLTDAYIHFCQYLRQKNMPPVNRKVFKSLVPPAVQDEFDLRVRNDLKDQATDKWHCGWKGIHALDLAVAEQEN